MRLPSDYKREYKFKSDKKRDRMNYIIAIIISAIAFLLIWYLF
ncbi:hypothetical protein SAMN04487898_1026 [Pedobacter sp. ok626]|nr:hypothetical protein SAMN04487898_1026 [Pedobacter sp. ok626]